MLSANSIPRFPDQPALSPAGIDTLWKRALDEAAEGITISDATLPDNPIIYVNRGFEKMTGYGSDEVVGRNCRFLQGEKTDPLVVARIRRAVEEGRECTVELRNYRKDGQPFWNRLSIRPLRDARGRVSHFIGIQSDVTRRRSAEDELRRAKRDLESAYRGLRNSLDAAAKIQRALLPSRPPRIDGFEFGWVFEPCEHLAGDSLNVMPLDDRHVALSLLDVTGHGLPAALLSVTLSRLLSSLNDESILFDSDGSGGGRRIATPSRVLERLNRQFPFEPETTQFFTIFYGVLDLRTLEVRYASAGHPPGIVVPQRGEARILDATGFPVGIVAEPSYLDRAVTLRPGDRLVLYTDGVTEAPDRTGEEFGSERLLGLLQATREQPLRGSLATALAAVEDWCGGDRFPDDVSMLAVEVGGRVAADR